MKRESKPRCPFVEAPSPDCYVTDLSSEDVEKAIFYCGGEFECCEIYARRMAMEKRRIKEQQLPIPSTKAAV